MARNKGGTVAADHARELRDESTPAERLVWGRLRHNQLGVHFRRQHRIAGFIVDFVCMERYLVVELDGSQHAMQKGYDERRAELLDAAGYRVLRFWNNDVLERTDEVLSAIVSALNNAPPPHPNPLRPVGRSGAPEPAVLCGAPLTPRRRRGRGGRDVLQRRIALQSGDVVETAKTASIATLPLPPAPLGGEGWGEGAAHRPIAANAFSLATPNTLSVSIAATQTRPPINNRRLALQNRATLNTLIRHFFSERDVLEVETPHLSKAGNTDPNIESFTTHFSGHRDAGPPERWLRTSPEFPLKRLLAEGIGDCYELGRVFRNGEAGRRHNPEFTMLEWYRVGWDHRALMHETQALVQAALAQRGRSAEVATYTYRELFLHHLNLDPFTASEHDLAAPLAPYQIDPTGLTRDDWLDLLITHRIQPRFSPGQITLIHDYPASQCALARIRCDGEFAVAERFELYLGPYELANGYHELNDATEQRARFERDNARRRERGLREVPLDENLLAVLAQLPDCAGVALGVERLLMCLAQTDDIREVLAFPFAQA